MPFPCIVFPSSLLNKVVLSAANIFCLIVRSSNQLSQIIVGLTPATVSTRNVLFEK